MEGGQLSSAQQQAYVASLAADQSDEANYDAAMNLNRTLRELEDRLTGAAAGRPPLPPKKSHEKPIEKKAESGSSESLRAIGGEAPKREVRHPSAGKTSSRASEPMSVVKGAGSTWMDWEPRRDAAREDASFTNDELYRIRFAH